jgi:hypothetical protein
MIADATALISNETRFPTQAFVACKQLAGWSVIMDVFHGINHEVAINTAQAVTTIGPLLQRLGAQMGDTPGAGLELICRVMYDMQQDYFHYLGLVAAGENPPVPTYQKVIDSVTTYRADSLSPMPTHWYLLAHCPRGRGSHAMVPTPTTAPAAMRQATGAGTVVNAHADKRLMERYKESGHATITALIGGRKLDFPTHGGKSVCMAWALKGSCSGNCKRAGQHVRYGAETKKALHKFLDDCGVTDPQP